METGIPAEQSPHFFQDLSQADTMLQWEPYNFSATSTFTLESFQNEIQLQRSAHLTEDTPAAEALSNTMPAGDISDTTTLCSLAFSLLLKNNLKGCSIADLDLKLRVGYRHGATPYEGCRIDNKILLRVLAEIS
jgi:hypothetical protein